MANPNFVALYSTNDIWRDLDDTRCLTDDLDTIEADIGALESGKAEADHEHTGYATSAHTHTPASIGAAAESHTHDYAASDHTHTPASIGAAAASHTHDYAAATHTHAQTEITGLVDALAAKADASALTAKADLVNGVVPTSQLPSFVDDVLEYANLSAFPSTGDSGKIYVAQDTNKTYRWSGSSYVVISDTIALGETSATAYRGDRGKIAYDHSQNSAVHVTAAQKAAWDSKAAGSHAHSEYAAASHTHDYAATGHTHTPASIGAAAASHSHSDYAAATHTHTDLAAASHTHALNAITGLLDMLLTDTAGRQKTTITGDVLTTIAGLPAGVHTCYSAGGSSATATNAPNTIESWRYLIHKNYAAYGWVMAFGSEGSFFLNYIDGGVWRGWKPIWDNNPVALWTGVLFMNANQTVTPSKKLSECKNGWVLLWSDYDTANSAATNGDVVATYIPKRCYSGGNWAGHSWLCEIPIEASASAESRCIKKVYMWNDRIVGNAINEANSRNDVVLRAVYEF